MSAKYVIDDLGVVAKGNAWMSWRCVKHPATGEELALAAMSKGGFAIINPRPGKQSLLHVRSPNPEAECWAAGQACNGGPIYAALYGAGEILRWDWEGDEPKVVGKLPAAPIFTLDVAPDGRVYLPNYSTGRLHRYDPGTGRVEDCGDFHEVGKNVRNVLCAKDGLVYVTCSRDRAGSFIGVFDPATGSKTPLQAQNINERNWQVGGIIKDSGGRVLVPFSRFGRTFYDELVGGKPQPVRQEELRLANGSTSLAFADGSYLTIPYREEVFDDPRQMVFVDAEGKRHLFEVNRPEYPLRIFSVENGAGRIWCGTFIPLRLASYDPASGKSVHLGNPTHATGEIYNMVFSHEKLYMASYTSSPVARYTPDKPWRKDDGIHANPAHLGFMKEDGPRLQRPYGKAIDPQGIVFFAARGDYGCLDSGICRIDPRTDEMTRWIYPNTSIFSMTFVESVGQLLVCERRQGEKPLRFTLISPEDGKVGWSEPMIDDEGEVASWLDSKGDLVYGLHAYRATLFAFSVSRKKIVKTIPEMRFGEHCRAALMFGLDDRVWGLTNEAVWAADRELNQAKEVANYRHGEYKNAYRFGICNGPDGAVYFANGPHLMRVRRSAGG